MSIQSEINRISGNVQDTISAIQATGVPIPSGANSDDLPALAQALANEKQDKLTGQQGQYVGFDSNGAAVATSKPTYTASEVGAMPAVSGGTSGQVLTKTEAGQEWQNPPDGLPSGGEEGQVLTKTASGTQWDDVPSDLPSGGTNGQILTKTADGVAWSDAPETGVTTFNGRTGAVTPQAGDYTAEMVGARPSTWTPSAADVGAVPTTRTVNGKALSSNISLTAADVGASEKAKISSVVLSASGWSSNSQTVTVTGVVANTNAQAIDVSPVSKTDADNWAQAGVWCTAQGANALTFTCTEVPSANINVNVKIQEV